MTDSTEKLLIASLTTQVVTEPAISEGEKQLFAAVLFALHKVLPPVIIVFGLVGNLLAFLVLRQPRYAKQTTCFYMRVLTVFDSSGLLGHASLRTAVNFDPKYMFGPIVGRVVCPMLTTLYGFYSLSNWVIAAMTFDRFLAVCFPLKVASWCTLKRCRIITAAILIVCITIISPYAFRSINPEGLVAKDICWFDPKIFPDWFYPTVHFIQMFFFFSTPFFLILVFNISIVAMLIRRRLITNASVELDVQKGQTKTDGHITILLFLVTIIFFITSVPWTFDQWIWGYFLSKQTMTPRLEMIRKILYECLVVLLITNPSVNFYVYCLGCRKSSGKMSNLSFVGGLMIVTRLPNLILCQEANHDALGGKWAPRSRWILARGQS